MLYRVKKFVDVI